MYCEPVPGGEALPAYGLSRRYSLLSSKGRELLRKIYLMSMASSLFPSRHICFAGGTKGKLPQAIPGIVAGIHAIDEFLIKEHIVIARAVLSDKLRPAADLGLDGSLGTQQEPLLRVSGQLRYHQQIRDDIHRFCPGRSPDTSSEYELPRSFPEQACRSLCCSGPWPYVP